MDGLFEILLSLSIRTGFVLLLVLGVRVFLKKTSSMVSYMLVLAALITFMIPNQIYSNVGIMPSNISSVNERGMLSNSINMTDTSKPIIVDEQVVNSANTTTNASASTSTATVAKSEIADTTNITFSGFISDLYIIILGIILAYSVTTYYKLARRVKTATHHRENIYLADGIDSPFVLGFIKPKIYLPTSLKNEELIIKHEQVHIRRFDHISKLVAYVICCINFFNPVFHLAFAAITNDIEKSCDEAVIRDASLEVRKAYSTSLLNIAKHSTGNSGHPVFFAEVNNKSRVNNILSYKKAKPITIILIVGIVGILFFMAISTKPPVAEQLYSEDTSITIAGIIWNRDGEEKTDTSNYCRELFTRLEWSDKCMFYNYHSVPYMEKFKKSENIFDMSDLMSEIRTYLRPNGEEVKALLNSDRTMLAVLIDGETLYYDTVSEYISPLTDNYVANAAQYVKINDIFYNTYYDASQNHMLDNLPEGASFVGTMTDVTEDIVINIENNIGILFSDEFVGQDIYLSENGYAAYVVNPWKEGYIVLYANHLEDPYKNMDIVTTNNNVAVIDYLNGDKTAVIEVLDAAALVKFDEFTENSIHGDSIHFKYFEDELTYNFASITNYHSRFYIDYDFTSPEATEYYRSYSRGHPEMRTYTDEFKKIDLEGYTYIVPDYSQESGTSLLNSIDYNAKTISENSRVISGSKTYIIRFKNELIDLATE